MKYLYDVQLQNEARTMAALWKYAGQLRNAFGYGYDHQILNKSVKYSRYGYLLWKDMN